MKNEQHLGGLWCHEILAHLTRFMDGDLDGEELVAVKSHVSGCDNCAGFGDAFARAIAALRDDDTSDDDTSDDDDDFTAGVLRALEP